MRGGLDWSHWHVMSPQGGQELLARRRDEDPAHAVRADPASANEDSANKDSANRESANKASAENLAVKKTSGCPDGWGREDWGVWSGAGSERALETTDQFHSPMLFPFGLCGSACDAADEVGHQRRHQERKLRLLRFWRDGAERQLAALQAAINTLERQMERDRPAG